jgi:TolB-like protein
VLFALALGEICAGDPASTIAHGHEALRLSPRDPLKHALYLMVSMGHFCLENYTEGVNFAQLGISESQANASLYAHLAVNLMGLGRQEEAAAAIAEMRRASAVFADQALAGRMQYRNAEYLQRSTTFLRRAAGVDEPEAPPVAAALTLPDKPSIAVLPFQNMSADPEQEYFTDGVTEDIITELSRFHELFVIARNSSFTYKDQAVDVRTVANELGVRYVLEGSIRKVASRIRVTGQLIDGVTGNHIWAERYDRVLDDIFAVQEELTQSIVRAIAPHISEIEVAKARRQRPENRSAYEVAVRAQAKAWEAWLKSDRMLRGGDW